LEILWGLVLGIWSFNALLPAEQVVLRLGFFLALFPILDVLLRDTATALAFAGILEFAGVVVGLATAEAFAIILAGAILDFGRFFDGGFLARRGRGAAVVAGVTAVYGGAAEQTGDGSRGDKCASGSFHEFCFVGADYLLSAGEARTFKRKMLNLRPPPPPFKKGGIIRDYLGLE
jgi:hypothetical protein